MPVDRSSIEALKNILAEVDLILSTTVPLPENRTGRCRELLRAALVLTDDLTNQDRIAPAAIIGSKGGAVTAKRGSDYFRALAAKRTTKSGGRPRKQG